MVPTATPKSLMAEASLRRIEPGRFPREMIPSPAVHSTATPNAPFPTTCPELLMPKACIGPTLMMLPSLQTMAPLGPVTATCPESLMPVASVPGPPIAMMLPPVHSVA